jgi:tetratricopeptide (TPR) repeat protein
MEAGRYAEAERYLLRAMEAITWDEPRFFAQVKYYLTHIYQKTGRPELARRTVEEVRDLAGASAWAPCGSFKSSVE